jgi:polyisoprenoid-binding protein YceI
MQWELEPEHSAAEFRARHMMVTWVRGAFKNIHGTLEFDPATCADLKLELTIDATKIWSGEPDRDAHLRTADFLDVENHPTITFKSTGCTRTSGTSYVLQGNLTIRGKTKPVNLAIDYHGSWKTPFGPDRKVTRLGFSGKTKINRHDFGVSWNAALDAGGIVVGDHIHIDLDLEAYA